MTGSTDSNYDDKASLLTAGRGQFKHKNANKSPRNLIILKSTDTNK